MIRQRMKRKLLFPIAVFAATTLLMVLWKPVFLAYYAVEASIGEWFAVLGHGLLLDLTVAGYVTVLPLLLTWLTLWVRIPARAGRLLLNGYFVVVSLVASLLFAVDLALYEFWGFRLDSTVLIYLSDPKEAAASIDLWMAVRQTLFFAASAAVKIGLYRRVVRLFDGERLARRAAAIGSLAMVLLAGLDFLAVRGGTGPSVANVSKVCFSPTLFLNHAATNPVFSFLSTIGKQERFADQYRFFDEAERAARFEAVRGNRPDSAPAERLLTTDRPNVVVIVLESFGRAVMEAEEEGRPVMPQLQRLRHEGLFFENFYANSFRTDRGQVSILSGFPAQTRTSLMKLTPKCLELPSIARSLAREGYRTSFVYGGDLNFTNQSSYMYATGWQELFWQKEMSFDAPVSKWGYDDRTVGDWFAEEVIHRSAEGTPFLAGWLTLSSHEPFEVPFEAFDDRMTNAFAFTDDCIGRFIERVRASEAWRDLLVILVPDHGMGNFRRGSYTESEIHRIPMLWLGGAVREPRVVQTYASQIDLAATLLGQLGVPHDDFEYSKDIFDPALPKFGYYAYNDGFAVVTAEGEATWDAASGRTSYRPADNDGFTVVTAEGEATRDAASGRTSYRPADNDGFTVVTAEGEATRDAASGRTSDRPADGSAASDGSEAAPTDGTSSPETPEERLLDIGRVLLQTTYLDIDRR